MPGTEQRARAPAAPPPGALIAPCCALFSVGLFVQVALAWRLNAELRCSRLTRWLPLLGSLRPGADGIPAPSAAGAEEVWKTRPR